MPEGMYIDEVQLQAVKGGFKTTEDGLEKIGGGVMNDIPKGIGLSKR